jgi:hypothetical protein
MKLGTKDFKRRLIAETFSRAVAQEMLNFLKPLHRRVKPLYACVSHAASFREELSHQPVGVFARAVIPPGSSSASFNGSKANIKGFPPLKNILTQ